MALLAEIVAASSEVAGTSSRSRKVGLLAELLRKLEPDEVPAAVGFLAGVPRQGRVGVGYSTIYGIRSAPAGTASLTVDDLDRAVAGIEAARGAGSAARRKQLLAGLLQRATEAEADFVRRLFTGSFGRVRSPG
jgi:DNA ligase-1